MSKTTKQLMYATGLLFLIATTHLFIGLYSSNDQQLVMALVEAVVAVVIAGIGVGLQTGGMG